jgi:uncharacterized membrane protein
MEYLLPFLIDWSSLLLRWLHLIVGIAWIGASFYFVWLDNSLVPATNQKLIDDGVSGELWAVHGGGFYNPQKYLNAPPQLPGHLHWFYWEAYSAWITGFLLFIVAYLINPSVMLVDKNIFDMSGQMAVIASLAYLVAGWVVYDVICRVFGVGDQADKKVAICLLIYVALASYLACQIFSGRAAFLMTGAMMATIMVANVFFWIIPGQKKVIASMKLDEVPEIIHGQRGKQRSVHNTFFTLPVLFAMLSNHYSMVYNSPHHWLVLMLMMLGGALIRFFFVSRHKNKPHYPALILGSFLLIAAIFITAPSRPTASSTTPMSAPNFAQVKAIIEQRCVACHNANIANKNIRLDSDESIQSQMALIYQQAVVTKIMPMNNATGITEDERRTLEAWFKAHNP